jgi:hypothetical protein
VIEGETLVGNPFDKFLVRVMRRFFSGGLEFSFFTTIIRSSFFGSFTMAASMTLKSGLKNILVFEKVWKSFVVT